MTESFTHTTNQPDEENLRSSLFSREKITVQATEVHDAIASVKSRIFEQGKYDGALGIQQTPEETKLLCEALTEQIFLDATAQLSAVHQKTEIATLSCKNHVDKAKAEVKKYEKQFARMEHLKMYDRKVIRVVIFSFI
jgi:hypothetical protein